MLIVDAQVHIWTRPPADPPHRQITSWYGRGLPERDGGRRGRRGADPSARLGS